MTTSLFAVSDLIDAVSISPLLQERKREIVRDLKRLCQVLRPLDGDPSRVPALPRKLRRIMARLSQAEFGCGRRRYQNILSNIRVGIGLAPEGKMLRRVAHHQLPEAWQAVMPKIPAKEKGKKPHPLYWHAVHVKPFIMFAVDAGLGPEELGPMHEPDFRAAILERTVNRKPERVVRDALNAWNVLRAALPTWPQVEMPVPKRERLWLDMGEFTPEFQAEVAEYERYCRDPKPFLHLKRIRSPKKGRYSEASIAFQLRTLRQCASLLVREGGVPVREIKSISHLVSRERFRLIVDILQRRHAARVERAYEEGGYEWEDERTQGDLTIARTLRTIGCNWCGPSKPLIAFWNEQVRRLESADVEIAGETLHMAVRKMGLSKKYQGRLVAFAEDRAKLVELLRLPHKLFQGLEKERARTGRVTRGMALLALAAAALLILWRMPVRFGNLRTINLDRHIRISRKRDKTTIEMKSVKVDDVELTITLKGPYHKGFWLFVRHYRPALLNGAESPWLFPSAEDASKPIPHGSLSRLLFDKEHGVVMKRIQARMNPHFWRHLIGWVIVAKDRSKLPLVSAVLGHKSLDTARRAYLEDDTKDAHDIIDTAMSEAIADAVAGSSLAKIFEEARF